MTRRAEHAEQVGQWIARRRAELGLTQAALADRLGEVASLRTVGNVERGATAVLALSRPAWESALQWPAGSLTLAYREGVRPGSVAELAEHHALLARAGVPDRYASHTDVGDIVGGPWSDAEKVSLLRLWHAQRETLERVMDQATPARKRRADNGR